MGFPTAAKARADKPGGGSFVCAPRWPTKIIFSKNKIKLVLWAGCPQHVLGRVGSLVTARLVEIMGIRRRQGHGGLVLLPRRIAHSQNPCTPRNLQTGSEPRRVT